MLQSVVCTLFENEYHYGVAALVNSLYQNKFRGIVWAGYRNALPNWVGAIKEGERYHEFFVAEHCSIRFLKCDTDRHLTWHKPEFMLRLFDQFCPEADIMFYMDPDIVIDADWSLFERWVSSGVALCSDKYWDVPSTHAARLAWKRYTAALGFNPRNEIDLYVNAGCVGVSKENIGFLKDWQRIQEPISIKDAWNPDIMPKVGGIGFFNDGDQYPLNATLDVTESPLSILGPDAMAFEPGFPLMFHAVGKIKPWSENIALRGPTVARAAAKFMDYSTSPIKLYTTMQGITKRLDIRAGITTGLINALFRDFLRGA